MKVYPDYTLNKIQRALKHKKEVIFTPGVYLIKKPLELYSNTRIELQKGAILRQAAAIDHIMITHSKPTTTGYNGVHDITITGYGAIEGMGKYNNPLNLLTLYHADNVKIEYIHFYDTQGFHALEINSSRNVKVDQCIFEGFRSFLGENEFREAIQIDSATEAGLYIHPIGSSCYDGTACSDIIITNNVMTASKNRPAFSRCVGNHSQSSKHHVGITISNNMFIGGNQPTPNSPAIGIIGMYDVIIRNNDCSGYGRFAKVYKQSYTYDNAGYKRPATNNEGTCNSISFIDNTIKESIGTNKNKKIYVSGKHCNIKIRE